MTLAVSKVLPETPVILDAPEQIIVFLLDGFFCDDNSFRFLSKEPLEPGVYYRQVELYSGQDDFEFVVITAEQMIGY